MKHPSEWPWIVRAPLGAFVALLVWWGPILAVVISMPRWTESLDLVPTFIIAATILGGWSWWAMRFVVHKRIEPYFDIRSLQNPNPGDPRQKR
jgi:hypothetical protein